MQTPIRATFALLRCNGKRKPAVRARDCWILNNVFKLPAQTPPPHFSPVELAIFCIHRPAGNISAPVFGDRSVVDGRISAGDLLFLPRFLSILRWAAASP